MRHKPLLVLCLFFAFLSLKSQSFQGKVVNSDHKLPVHEVEILDDSGSKVSSSDVNGLFQLANKGNYTFQKLGYISKTMTIKDTTFILVEMIEQPFDLGEIIIKSSHFQSELKQISSSISVISENQIKSNDGVNIAPILNTVPGVYMHNGTLNTNRITIRGIGSRNLFGTSKIRAYYEDIPLTNGSGETTIEDIELQGIARMEVLKGPSSSLYGAGLGGSIQFIADKGLFDTQSIQTAFTFGSFGLMKFLINTNLGNKQNAAKLTYSNTNNDGYRDNNELKRQTFTSASNHSLNEKNNLNVIANFIDLKAYIPSSLNEDDYRTDPSKAAFTWGRSQGFEDYTKFLLGVSWQHEYNDKSKQVSSIFGSLLDSYEARPFNILEQDTRAIGLRTRFIQKANLLKKNVQWTAGFEFFNDFNFLKTYENLYQEFPPGTGSVQGELLSDFDEKRYYFNLFTELKYFITQKFILDLGVNLNQTAYNLDDNFNTGNDNFTGDYRFDAIWSPKLGLTYQVNQHSMIFATISHGFSPPKLEETLLPDGLINDKLNPKQDGITKLVVEENSLATFLIMKYPYTIWT